MSDGCSGGMSFAWRKATGKPPPWQGCCEAHDESYRKGGPPDARLRADRRLRACVAETAYRNGYPRLVALSIAWSMYLGVRVGGARNAPPLHLLAVPAVWARGKLPVRFRRLRAWLPSEAPDYRFGRLPPA